MIAIKNRRQYSDLIKEAVVKEYIRRNKGKNFCSLQTIGNEFNIDKSTVCRWVKNKKYGYTSLCCKIDKENIIYRGVTYVPQYKLI